MRTMLDASAIIYLIESVEPFVTTIRQFLKTNDTLQICSDLSRLECRVKPLREGQKNVLTAYDNYFSYVATEIIPLTGAVIDQATTLRAKYGFKTRTPSNWPPRLKANMISF